MAKPGPRSFVPFFVETVRNGDAVDGSSQMIVVFNDLILALMMPSQGPSTPSP